MHYLNLSLRLGLLLASQAAAAFALPEYGAPPAETFTQYHTQDVHGQYAYGYTAPLSSKHETRTVDGITHGAYSYVDARGEQQTVKYQADRDGFRIIASSLLPQRANEETAEVAALRAQHVAAHAAAKLRLASEAPAPVQDTPEVAAAKLAFFKRFEAEKLRNQLAQSQSQSQSILPSRNIFSQPIYVLQPTRGFVQLLSASARDYLPVH